MLVKESQRGQHVVDYFAARVSPSPTPRSVFGTRNVHQLTIHMTGKSINMVLIRIEKGGYAIQELEFGVVFIVGKMIDGLNSVGIGQRALTCSQAGRKGDAVWGLGYQASIRGLLHLFPEAPRDQAISIGRRLPKSYTYRRLDRPKTGYLWMN